MLFKKTILLFIFSFFVISCSRSTFSSTLNKNDNKKIDILINEAKKYLGTVYKYGGDSNLGIDCSGLVFNSFKAINIFLPRNSKEMSLMGTKVEEQEVRVGDLLFFKTNQKSISHVAIVEKIIKEEVFFIHSSSSKGVTISSMKEKYWKNNFVIAKRINL